MLKAYTADLHIHSCLSPCGDLDMSPRKIVEIAIKHQLDMIAITDHNAAENISATLKAAEASSLTILAGMEVTSAEEAHLLVLFENLVDIIHFQTLIYDHLSSFNIDKRTVGDQVIVNELDEVEGFNDHLLLGATSLTLQELVDEVHRLNGLAIASHVDRESYSILGQLGFIPDDLPLDALEISPLTSTKEARMNIPDANRFPLVTFSDAHYLKDIGRQTTRFLIEAPTIRELKLALTNAQGRKVLE